MNVYLNDEKKSVDQRLLYDILQGLKALCVMYLVYFATNPLWCVSGSTYTHSLHQVLGGFQLLDLIIPELKSHVIPYKFKSSHWLKLQHSDWRANLVKDKKYFYKNLKKYFCPQKVEKTTPKSCILMAVGRFFSLQPLLPKTAQNFISVL